MYCKYCGEIKPSSLFPKTKRTICKKCASQKSIIWQKKNRIRARATNKRWADRNRKRLRAYFKEWYKKNGNKETDIQELAHNAIKIAIKSKRIVRPNICSFCSMECIPSAHHEDYYKPYDVIWLCNSCHRLKHVSSIEVPRLKGL